MEQFRLAMHKQFGTSSEQTNLDQLYLFNEAEQTADLKGVARIDSPHRRSEVCYGQPVLPAGAGVGAEWHSAFPPDHVQLAHQSLRGLAYADIQRDEAAIMRASSHSRG